LIPAPHLVIAAVRGWGRRRQYSAAGRCKLVDGCELNARQFARGNDGHIQKREHFLSRELYFANDPLTHAFISQTKQLTLIGRHLEALTSPAKRN